MPNKTIFIRLPMKTGALFRLEFYQNSFAAATEKIVNFLTTSESKKLLMARYYHLLAECFGFYCGTHWLSGSPNDDHKIIGIGFV